MAGFNDFFVVLSVSRIFQQVAEYQNPGLFVLFDVLVSNVLPLLLSNRTRSEQKVGKDPRDTHSFIPTVPEGVGANIQANSKRKCPPDDRAKEHACKVKPLCQQRD